MPVSLYTIRVPTDYPDLQSAFVVATKAPALRVNIVIDSGYQPASGITCANGDFSHIWIQSQSGTVTLPANFSGSFLSGSNCGMPVLDCLVDMGAAQAAGVGLHGYSADRASRGYIPAGRGVMNATEIGLWCRRNSVITAQSTVWSGAGVNAVRSTHGASLDIRGSNLTNLLGTGPKVEADYVRAAIGADAGFVDASLVDVSGGNGEAIRAELCSTINFAGSTARNMTASNAIYIDTGTTVVLGNGSGDEDHCNFDGFSGDFLFRLLNGSKIQGSHIKARGLNSRFVSADSACVVDLQNSTFDSTSTNTTGMFYFNQSVGDFKASTIKTAGRLLMAIGPETSVNFRSCVVDNPEGLAGPAQNSVAIQEGASVNIEDASITQCQSAICNLSGGSRLNATNATLQKADGVSAGLKHISVTEGSEATAAGAIVTGGGSISPGDTNLAAFNTNYANGIIRA